MKNSLFIFILLLLLDSRGNGQIIPEKSVEFPVTRFNVEDNLIISAEDRVHLVRNTGQLINQGFVWNIVTLDRDLNSESNRSFVIPAGYKLQATDTSNREAFLFFSNILQPRIARIIQVSEDQTLVYDFRILVPMMITRFRMIDEGKKVLLAGHINYRPIATMIDLISSKPVILPGLLNKPGVWVSIKVTPQFRTIDFLVRHETRGPERGLWLKSYNFDGRMLKNVQLQPPGDKMAISHANLIKLNEKQHILIGVYGRRGSQFSRGLYYSVIEEEDEFNHKLINYARLENFFDFMRPRRIERVKKRITRKREKGKIPRFYYRVVIQDVTVKGGEIIIAAESYFMKYDSPIETWYFNSLGRYNNLVFDGYGYTHFFSVGMNLDGELKWDNSIKASQVKQYELEPLVQSIPGDHTNLLVFPERNQIGYSLVNVQNERIDRNNYTFETKYDSDEIMRGEHQNLRIKKWHDSSFLVYGEVEIRNTREVGIPLRRQVFAITKYQYKLTP